MPPAASPQAAECSLPPAPVPLSREGSPKKQQPFLSFSHRFPPQPRISGKTIHFILFYHGILFFTNAIVSYFVINNVVSVFYFCGGKKGCMGRYRRYILLYFFLTIRFLLDEFVQQIEGRPSICENKLIFILSNRLRKSNKNCKKFPVSPSYAFFSPSPATRRVPGRPHNPRFR